MPSGARDSRVQFVAAARWLSFGQQHDTWRKQRRRRQFPPRPLSSGRTWCQPRA